MLPLELYEICTCTHKKVKLTIVKINQSFMSECLKKFFHGFSTCPVKTFTGYKSFPFFIGSKVYYVIFCT